MKFPVTETWQNAYTLSGLAPGSEPIFGSGPASSRIGGDVIGLEYPLKEATDHVFTVSNPGLGSADVFWWITGYEGVPNLPYS